MRYECLRANSTYVRVDVNTYAPTYVRRYVRVYVATDVAAEDAGRGRFVCFSRTYDVNPADVTPNYLADSLKGAY